MPAAKRRRDISDDVDAREPDTPRFGAEEDELSQTVYAIPCRDPDRYSLYQFRYSQFPYWVDVYSVATAKQNVIGGNHDADFAQRMAWTVNM